MAKRKQSHASIRRDLEECNMGIRSLEKHISEYDSMIVRNKKAIAVSESSIEPDNSIQGLLKDMLKQKKRIVAYYKRLIKDLKNKKEELIKPK